MKIKLKDALGITIIVVCAIFVCTLFLNYHIDLSAIGDKITVEPVRKFYDAQIATAKVVSAISGGCLLITSVIMLFFYIKHYIDTHKKEIGILKALGYSNIRIAKDFWGFGLSVFFGACVGFGGAFLMMPSFYEVQNEDKILPEISINFHFSLFACLVLLPTVAFALLAVFYACHKLKRPPLELLKDNIQMISKSKKRKTVTAETSFLSELKRNILSDKKILAFFMIFASFCFSAMTQMSASMNELASTMMGITIMIIGIILACTTLFMAVTTVIKGNTKTIAIMRVFGYSQKACCNALLGVYRPLGYIGFAIGSAYQYILLKIMVSVVFKDIEGVPEYHFDFVAMGISFVAFVVLYESVMYIYSQKIKKVSVKEIML
ncbi:MAG: FtsX-like permease family protein, partial [Acutalibacteraceae bacterium]